MDRRLSSSRLRRTLARLVLVSGGMLGGVALAEILLRLVLPQTLGLRWYTREGILVHVPGLRATYVRPEYRTRIEIDSDGLRDREYPPGKPAGTYRILLLGDSYAEGVQVPAEATFPKRVEELLRTARPDVRFEVVNAGVAGYGTADELRYLEAYGPRWKPDLVLLAFYCGNDVRNNFTEREIRREGGRLEVGRKGLTGLQYRVKGTRSWIAAHSHLWQLLRARLPFGRDPDERRRPPRKQGFPETSLPAERRVTGGSEQKPEGPPKPWSETPFEEYDDRDVMRVDPGPDFTRGWELTRELIARIDQAARALGARTAIVALPGRWQCDTKLLASRVGAAAVADGTFDPARPGRIVCGYAGEIGVPCLDLFPAFRAAGADATWYWKMDSHFTPGAHEAAARQIAPFLVEHVLPERAP